MTHLTSQLNSRHEGIYFHDGMVTFHKKSMQKKVESSESSNVYTGTPYSGWGQYKPLVSTRIPRINWSHSWLFELTRRHSLDQLILGIQVDTQGSYFAPISYGVAV